MKPIVNQFSGTTILSLIISLMFLTFGLEAQNADKELAIVKGADDSSLQWNPCPEFMPEGCNISVLHGNPKQPNTDIFFRFEGGTTIPYHWHHSPERMILVSGKMKVSYEDQSPEIVESGEYAYGPAERKHKAECLSDEPCVIFIAFEDPIDAIPVSQEKPE